VDKTYGYISIHLPTGKFLGMLESRIKCALGAITRTCSLRIEVFLKIEKQQFDTQKLRLCLKLDGSKSASTAVADALYEYDLFLQKPDPEVSDLPYKNPQELEIPMELLEQFRSMELSQPSTVLRKVEVKDMLSELWKSNRGPLQLQTCKFTGHLETPLLPSVYPHFRSFNIILHFSRTLNNDWADPSVNSHQIEALSFLRAREEECNASERTFKHMSPA
jgi:hypothetical protein